MTGLSVLTLVKDRSTHLDRLIEGLDRSATAPRELIIVDMSDPSLTLRSSTRFPTRVIALPTEGLPLAAARNLAGQSAQGDRLLFLDVDCIPRVDLVSRMDRELQAHDALLCAEVRYLAAGAVRDGWTEAGLHDVSEPHPVRLFPAEGSRREENAGLFWSLAFGMRRRTFETLGGFDEAFRGYGAEDTDFGFRCREAGLPLLFLGGSGAFHQHHGVYDPPLQHFDDILENARRFHDRWGLWPMDGWLRAFAAKGLVRFDGEHLQRLRAPEANEITASLRPPDVRF